MMSVMMDKELDQLSAGIVATPFYGTPLIYGVLDKDGEPEAKLIIDGSVYGPNQNFRL
jgi:hypothetical protein